MSKTIVGFVAFAALTVTPALAADMAVKAPAAPTAPVINWTGFYLGAGYGYGLWDADTQTLTRTQSAGGRGWLGLVTGGYDYQFNDRIVVGVQADFDFGDIKGAVEDPGPFWVATTRETMAGSVGARAGWLLTPAILTYVNGGWSEARFAGGTLIDETNLNGISGTSSGFVTPSTTRSGYFVGGGVETAVSPGWFWRNEYRFASYSSANLPETNPTTGATTGTVIRFRPDTQTITSALVYKFNSGSAPAYTASQPVGASRANWSGAYVGAGGGFGMWDADSSLTSPAIPGCACGGPSQTDAGKGPLGVVTAGYDYQFSAFNMNLVAGPFADFDFGSIKGTLDDAQTFTTANTRDTDAWAAGVRGGWLVTPAILSYFNGGWSEAHFAGGSMVGAAGPNGAATPSVNLGGWFLGGGVETMLSSNWSWRNEYRYASYHGTTLVETGASGGDTLSFHPYVQTFTTQLVYKF